MAIIFNIDEAVKLSAFNVLQEPIKMLLENEKELFEKQSMLGEIFVMKTTEKYQEEYRSKTSMDGFKPTEDLEVAGLSDFEEGFGKTFKTQIWTNAFAISKQAIEDNQDMSINTEAVGFIKSYGRTRELFGFAMLAGAVSGSCVYGGKTFDCTGMDTVDGALDSAKQKFFHNTHKSPVAGVTDQSNKFYASIDLTEATAHRSLLSVIGQVETAMMNYTDYKGNIITVAPTTILLPNHYAFKDCLLTALKTQYTDAMGTNGINLQYGKWKVLVSAYLNKHTGFAAADQSFIMIDPQTNKENLGAVWFDRKSLEVDSWIDKKTKANIWDGRARYSAGFGDFKAMAYVNCATANDADAATLANATFITA